MELTRGVVTLYARCQLYSDQARNIEEAFTGSSSQLPVNTVTPFPRRYTVEMCNAHAYTERPSLRFRRDAHGGILNSRTERKGQSLSAFWTTVQTIYNATNDWPTLINPWKRNYSAINLCGKLNRIVFPIISNYFDISSEKGLNN